jgi:hypothetical protein
MDIESYYENLVIELERASNLIKRFHDIQFAVNDDKYTYLADIYIANLVSSSILTYLAIFRGAHALERETGTPLQMEIIEDLGNDPFTTNLFKAIASNPALAKTILSATNEVVRDGFLNEILSDLNLHSSHCEENYHALTRFGK